MSVGFEYTCTASGKRSNSRVIPKLCGWINETLRLNYMPTENSLLIKNILVIINVSPLASDPSLIPKGG